MRTMSTMTVGTMIKNAREATGLTITDLARRSTVSRTFLGEVESGKRTPSIKTASKVFTVLARLTK